MKKAMVTGASGFVGRYLVKELLEHDIAVFAIIRPNSKNNIYLDGLQIEIVECDSSEYRYLPSHISGCDICFHAAWQGVYGSDAKNQIVQINNIRATLDLIDAAKKIGVSTFVGCGSIHEKEVIHEMAGNKPVDNLANMYKTAKVAAHWMGKARCGSYGIRFFWPQIINAYGEEESSSRLINTTIRKILKGEEPTLSAATQLYDFVHVSDVANALYMIAESGKDGQDYIIGSGQVRPLWEYLDEVNNITNEINGSNIGMNYGAIQNGVVSLSKDAFDASRLFDEIGWRPEVSFKEGIGRTVNWIKDNFGIQ